MTKVTIGYLSTNTKFVQSSMNHVRYYKQWRTFVTWCCWENTILIIDPGFRIASYMRPVLLQLAQRVGQRAAVAEMVIAKTPVDARKIMLSVTVGVVAMGTASMGTALAL